MFTPYYRDVIRAKKILENFEPERLYTKKEYQAIATTIGLPKEWGLDKGKFAGKYQWTSRMPEFVLEKVEKFELKKPILYIMPNAEVFKAFKEKMSQPWYNGIYPGL